jgi:tRNA nucleotidyltransferase (CCA-adding enzyme)
LKKRLRTPLEPDITYSDDPLRMLRIRFANQLGFKIEEKSLNSITKMQESRSSLERIVDELNKILSTDKPSVVLLLLF